MQLKNVLFASTGVVEKESLKTILIKSNYYMTSLIKSFKSRKYIQNMNFYLSNSVKLVIFNVEILPITPPHFIDIEFRNLICLSIYHFMYYFQMMIPHPSDVISPKLFST